MLQFSKVRGPDLKNQQNFEHELLKELMDHVPDIIYFKDRQGRLVMVNQAHAKGLGLKPAEVIGKTDFDFFSKEVAEKMTRDDEKVMSRGLAIVDKIERGTDPKGLDNYVSTTKIPRLDAQGHVIGLMGITRDITARMRLKQSEDEKARIKKKLKALEAVSHLKSEFVSAVSHELRTPLAIIKEVVNLMSDSLAGPVNQKQKNLLTKAGDNINRLQHIIDELLDISRIETGKLRLHYSLINLKDLMMDSSDYFKKCAREKGIRLSYTLPKEEVHIFVDMSRVVQIIHNLIDNALKYTEKGGHVNVGLEILQDKVRVVVADTGVGMAKEDLPKLFTKFVQVSKVAGAEKKGVGLGLSIAKELVEKHGGEIWAESRLGRGSKFFFTLPRQYSLNRLDKHLKEKVNSYLKRGVTVYLINLSLVHFPDLRQRVDIKPEKLIHDLRGLIQEAFESTLRSGTRDFEIVGLDTHHGEFSVIFPHASEEKAIKVYVLLKYKIENYFVKNKIENVFVNISKLPYFLKTEFDAAQETMGSLFIKRIYIGIEKRRHRRMYYRISTEILLPDRQAEKTETLDISKGGLCFLTGKPLETDKRVEVKLKLPQTSRPFLMKGRVAWVKRIEEIPGKADRYKVGVEFLHARTKAFVERLAKLQS